MAITFALVERTPYTLRYLATSDGAPTAGPDSGTIPNTGAGTPDLGGDAASAGPQILALVNTTVTTQAAARTLLNGDSLTTGGAVQAPRARISVTPRNTSGSSSQWAVDANVIANRAVINVIGPDTATAAAYVELHFRHSEDR